MFPRIRKGFSLCGFNWNENAQRAEAMEKNIPEPKAELVCMCVREKNNNFFEGI